MEESDNSGDEAPKREVPEEGVLDDGTIDDTDGSFRKYFKKFIHAFKPHVRTREMPQTPPVAPHDDKDVYTFSSQEKGLAVIINNEEFDLRSKLSDREGAKKDARNLLKIFKHLGFETKYYENLTARQMVHTLQTIAGNKKYDLNQVDCFACAILSHGDNGIFLPRKTQKEESMIRHDIICGTDGEVVPTRYLLSIFNDECCPELEGKPRLVFLQACRGDHLADPAYITVLEKKKKVETTRDKSAKDAVDAVPGCVDELQKHEHEKDHEHNQEQEEAKEHEHNQEQKDEEEHEHKQAQKHGEDHEHNQEQKEAKEHEHKQAQKHGEDHEHNKGQKDEEEHEHKQAQKHGEDHEHNQEQKEAKEHEHKQAQKHGEDHEHNQEQKDEEEHKHKQEQEHEEQGDQNPSTSVADQQGKERPRYLTTITPSPIYKDFLVLYAAPPGHFAWRNAREGSWMIQCLTKVMLSEDVFQIPLTSLLRQVSWKMSRMVSDVKGTQLHEKMSVPCVTSMLTKDVYFKKKNL
ncbi:caspase-7-like isoform X2 [Haliotis rufescens]|uniref:caspase-7-like isoform X2 n=1 Tax=Haliotis rufescens TaxID=6454 RepID=UPI00201F286C|nr:caspase-7-like isoform X2 [Haliotis rufescens]